MLADRVNRVKEGRMMGQSPDGPVRVEVITYVPTNYQH